MPNIGNPTSNIISYKDEQILGEFIYFDIQKQLPIIQEPIIDNYIQKLGDKLVQNSNSHFKQFKFFIVNSNDINAFAFPGGYIGINKGIFKIAQTEDEVAAVVAHEITHINQRHIARGFAKQKQLQIPMIAGMIAGALLSAYSPEAGQSLIAGSMAAGAQSIINYTRSNEIEADNIGMQILYKSGYKPIAMADIFNKMKANDFSDAQSFPEYLRTHPVNDKRIADARNRADEIILNNKNNSNKNKNNLDFSLIKTLLTVTTAEHNNIKNIINNKKYSSYNKPSEDNNKNNKLDQFEQDISEFNLAYRYLLNQNYDKAQSLLQKLHKKFPDNNIIAILYAKSYANMPVQANIKNNTNLKKATEILSKQINKYNNNKTDLALSLEYATISINNKEYTNAINILKNIPLYYDYYPAQINFLLAKAYEKNNQTWRAALAYSEYSDNIGDIDSALMQLKATAKYNKLTDYQSKIIKYRIKLLEEKFQKRQEQIKAWL